MGMKKFRIFALAQAVGVEMNSQPPAQFIGPKGVAGQQSRGQAAKDSNQPAPPFFPRKSKRGKERWMVGYPLAGRLAKIARPLPLFFSHSPMSPRC